MDPLFSEIPAAQALRGITLRVQRRPGPPDEFDDPFASEITVSGAQSDAVQQYAEDDLDMVLDDQSPMMAMMNRDTVNRTSYLENNYPISAQASPSEEYDPMAMMGGGDPAMMAAMMGGGDPMAAEEPMGPTGRRGVRGVRRNPAAIMKGLGF